MTVVVVTGPEDVLDIEDVKLHLRVDDDAEDQLIAGQVAAAVAALDGPDGWLGRCLGVQTLDLILDAWPCGPLALPYPPVIEVVEVTYVDAFGELQTLDEGVYRLGADGRLVLATGSAWPPTNGEPEAIRIQYRAGYEVLPAPIRQALMLMVGDLYTNRTAQIIAAGAATQITNPAARSLLFPYLAWDA